MYDLMCIGICLLDSIIKGFDNKPLTYNHHLADSNTLAIGGEAFNQSVIASRLGLKTSILSYIGNDFAGDLIIKELNKNDVDASNCIRNNDIATPISTLFVNEDGSRSSITNSSHHYNFHPEQYLFLLNNCKAISFGSLFRAPFDDKDIIYSVLKQAKQLDIITYVDTKIPNYNKLSLDDIKDSLPLIDYIFPNYDEATYLTNEKDYKKQADILLEYGIKNVIIKLGGDGCYFKNDIEEFKLDCLKAKVIDTSGAGDNFIAGFIAYKNNGYSNLEALKFANKCGALACEKIGATTALKDSQQVMERFEG